ncbi:MAG: GNAT family N-acetyltransferase [Desulfobacter sp.]|nr:MAG: GNAT family N-acetyltransferase [Desulfobacter sp.]
MGKNTRKIIFQDNAPSHPSFGTPEWIIAGMDRGEAYFLGQMGDQAVGCVAYESPEPEIAYLNRLAVLPGFQNKGVGKKLVSHVIDRARKDEKKQVSIGIIKAHKSLKNWYLSLGFEISGTKVFDHLPFDVLFMTLDLNAR